MRLITSYYCQGGRRALGEWPCFSSSPRQRSPSRAGRFSAPFLPSCRNCRLTPQASSALRMRARFSVWPLLFPLRFPEFGFMDSILILERKSCFSDAGSLLFSNFPFISESLGLRPHLVFRLFVSLASRSLPSHTSHHHPFGTVSFLLFPTSLPHHSPFFFVRAMPTVLGRGVRLFL